MRPGRSESRDGDQRRARNADSDGDTIVLSTADRFGNMVAWVNSLYDGFGSGLTVPGYGFTLHNRGGLFTLDPKSPNAIAPHKRPFNTLSAGFVMRNNQPLMTVTLMGGDMQAQGIAQVLLNVLDLGANLQAAIDMARFRHSQVPNMLSLESQLFDARRRAAAGDGARREVDQRRHRWAATRRSWSRPRPAFIAPARIIARTARPSGTSA